MKKLFFAVSAALVLTASFLFAGDVKKDIVGVWSFDMGGGYMATAEYKANGTFEQTMTGMVIKGTYTVNGQKVTTDANGKKTVFTVVASDAKSLTMKRDADGRTVVYKKK